MLPTVISSEPIVMSTLEWKIAEVEYSPPHAPRPNALPGRSRVTTKVPLAFDGPIKQPIREPRCADGHGMLSCAILPGGLKRCVAFLSPNGGSTVSFGVTLFSLKCYY